MKLIILIVLLTSCVPNADTLERWGAARNEETKNVMIEEYCREFIEYNQCININTKAKR